MEDAHVVVGARRESRAKISTPANNVNDEANLSF